MATPKPQPEATATGGAQSNIFLDMIPLSRLHFGHELKSGSVNSRKASRGEVATLAKSIKELGLLVPLTIIDKGGYYTVDGNSRLAALHSIYKAADRVDILVPCYYGVGDAKNALEASMVANTERKSLHPVDQFEVFADLVKDGATVEQLAARYMLKIPQVRQALSLARMAPEIRDAWREGKIGADAAEAFAQTKDHEQQVRILKKLKGRASHAWDVRNEIVGNNRTSVGELLRIVGADAYVKAGHQINESLFPDEDRHRGDGATVDNVPALKALVDAKIEAEIKRLQEAGWGWVIRADKAPSDIGSWRRLPTANATKEQKALAGCTVGLPRYNGSALEIVHGYVKPGTSIKIPGGAAAKKSAAKAKATRDESGGINGSLALRLSTSLTHAACAALQKEPALALRVAIAAIASQEGGGSPAHISTHGFHELSGDDENESDFDKYLPLTAKKSPGDLLKMLAGQVARSLNLVAHSATSLPLTGEDQAGERALLDELDPAELNAQILKAFDAKNYFESVAGPMVTAAIKEMGGLPPAGGSKKATLVAFALPLQKDKVWLPVEMRCAGYTGPKAAAPAKPKAKGAKPRAKK